MHDRPSQLFRNLAVASLLGAAASFAQAGTDVKINADAAGTVQNEIRITQNPTDANNFIVGYNDLAGSGSPSPLGVSYSLDGGATWTDLQLSIPTHPILMSPDDGIFLNDIFDPFIDSDSQGNIYAGYIATDGTAGGPGGIYIERSTNKGVAWSGPDVIAFDVRAAMVPPVPDPYRFNDRPDMTVDSNDHVYVVWIKDVGQGMPTSDIYFSKSPPPGAGPGLTGLDFSGPPVMGSIAPKTINDTPGGSLMPPAVTDSANVPDIAVAADGTIYVAWINVDVTNTSAKPAELLLDLSTDGGVTFGTDIVVQSITALPKNISTSMGAGDDVVAGSYPQIATDPSNSQTIYMVYAAVPGGGDEADIYFTKSTNSGTNWSAPYVINDDGTTTDQIHPVIAVKSDGTIDVAWYDKRSAMTDDHWDVYMAKSTDGGASFSTNVPVTDQSFASPTNALGAPWLGEYLGLEVDGSNAYLAFTSGVTAGGGDSKGDVYFDSLPNATVSIELGSFTIE